MAAHKQLGYVMLALILFRFSWGFLGSGPARFSGFIRGPKTVISYATGRLKDKPSVVGHNPLGGWSVVALLGLLASDVACGLFTQDVDGIESGPLARFVSYDTAEWARGWHAALFNVLLAAVALHLTAIIFYLIIKRDNLIGPMISGYKSSLPQEPKPQFVSARRAIVISIVCASIAYWISMGCPTQA